MQTVNDALIATDTEFAAMTDADVRRLAYGIEYFEFSRYNASPFDKPTPELSRRLEVLRERLNAMKQPRRASGRAEIVCDCGHTAAHPMNSSRGTCCPDCYDRMSN